MDEILAAHETEIERLDIVPGGGGVFEVDVDGRRVYSKKATGRHARPGEVLQLLAQLLAQRAG